MLNVNGIQQFFLLVAAVAAALPAVAGEKLYNGIELPDRWPQPSFERLTREVQRVPYLEHRPDVVPIDVGRQLFVDDFLVERTDLRRVWHYPVKYAGNPVLKPETPLELNRPSNSCARVSAGGLWWDPKRRVYRLWYDAGWMKAPAYAESGDGLSWRRIDVGVVPGTNRIMPDAFWDNETDTMTKKAMRYDGWAVTPDFSRADPYSHWFLYVRPPGPRAQTALVAESEDGLRWSACKPVGKCGDASSIFYNPFRRKWVFSLRNEMPPWGLGGSRIRSYREADDFLAGALGSFEIARSTADTVLWLQPDRLEPRDPNLKLDPQLYDFDAVAYESLIVGGFGIWKGPENHVIAKCGMPKINDLCFGFSRDGFHFSREDRTPSVAAERWASGKWDAGYIRPMPNLFAVEEDRILVYYAAAAGDPSRLDTSSPDNDFSGCYDRIASGVAILRRDGFASMRPGVGMKRGELVTRPLKFSGRHLFVNADAAGCALRAEALDASGSPIAPYTAENCRVVAVDSTRASVGWKGADDLSPLAGRTVRFRFVIETANFDRGDLYAFWVSKSPRGESGGYLGGGGRGYPGVRDL